MKALNLAKLEEVFRFINPARATQKLNPHDCHVHYEKLLCNPPAPPVNGTLWNPAAPQPPTPETAAMR